MLCVGMLVCLPLSKTMFKKKLPFILLVVNLFLVSAEDFSNEALLSKIKKLQQSQSCIRKEFQKIINVLEKNFLEKLEEVRRSCKCKNGSGGGGTESSEWPNGNSESEGNSNEQGENPGSDESEHDTDEWLDPNSDTNDSGSRGSEDSNDKNNNSFGASDEGDYDSNGDYDYSEEPNSEEDSKEGNHKRPNRPDKNGNGSDSPEISEEDYDDEEYGKRVYRSCREVKKRGKKSGYYLIKPKTAPKPFRVWCVNEHMGGGWTAILHRVDGSTNFGRNYTSYKKGFGKLRGSFWLGLEKIKYLTDVGTELLVMVKMWNNKQSFENFKTFSIGSAKEGYKIKKLVGGNANLFGLSVGRKFSTTDRDYSHGCPNIYGGRGWWFTNCAQMFLTRKRSGMDKNTRAHELFDNQGPFKKATMLLRTKH